MVNWVSILSVRVAWHSPATISAITGLLNGTLKTLCTWWFNDPTSISSDFLTSRPWSEVLTVSRCIFRLFRTVPCLVSRPGIFITSHVVQSRPLLYHRSRIPLTHYLMILPAVNDRWIENGTVCYIGEQVWDKSELLGVIIYSPCWHMHDDDLGLVWNLRPSFLPSDLVLPGGFWSRKPYFALPEDLYPF